MKTNINLKTDSIDELSNELKKGSINLNNILDYLINLTIDMDNFFDTPTAKIMKESLIEYLKNSKESCNNLNELSNTVLKSKELYELLHQQTRDSLEE